MKRICLFFCAMSLCLVTSLAFAADGAAIYKTCAGCHGPDGSKSSAGSPILKGLAADEVLQKLEGYKAGTYGGKTKAIMDNIVKKHSPEDLKAVADYIGTFK